MPAKTAPAKTTPPSPKTTPKPRVGIGIPSAH